MTQAFIKINMVEIIIMVEIRNIHIILIMNVYFIIEYYSPVKLFILNLENVK